MVWKSSMVSSTPASCAIASRCSTALVDPPVAATDAMAFSNALRVAMSRGRRLARTASIDDLAAAERHLLLARVHLRHGGGVHGREPDHLHHGRHGVGGELSAASAGAGTGRVLDRQQFRIGDLAARRLRRPLRTHPASSDRGLVMARHDRCRRTAPRPERSAAAAPWPRREWSCRRPPAR